MHRFIECITRDWIFLRSSLNSKHKKRIHHHLQCSLDFRMKKLFQFYWNSFQLESRVYSELFSLLNTPLHCLHIPCFFPQIEISISHIVSCIYLRIHMHVQYCSSYIIHTENIFLIYARSSLWSLRYFITSCSSGRKNSHSRIHMKRLVKNLMNLFFCRFPFGFFDYVTAWVGIWIFDSEKDLK